MDQVQSSNQSTTHTAKKFFITFLIVLFILIITVILSICTILKHHAQSQSATHSGMTRYYYPCINSISSLHKTHTPSSSSKIDASYIFGLSIQAASFQFYNISKLPEKLASRFKNREIEPALKVCRNMFNISLTNLHEPWILTKNFQGPNGKILADEEMVKNLRILTEGRIHDIESCVDELEAKWIQWRIPKTEVKLRIFMAKACMYVE